MGGSYFLRAVVIFTHYATVLWKRNFFLLIELYTTSIHLLKKKEMKAAFILTFILLPSTNLGKGFCNGSQGIHLVNHIYLIQDV